MLHAALRSWRFVPFLLGMVAAVVATTGGVAIEHRDRFVCADDPAVAESFHVEVRLLSDSRRRGIPLLYHRLEETGPYHLALAFKAGADSPLEQVEIRQIVVQADTGQVYRFAETPLPLRIPLQPTGADGSAQWARKATVVLPERLDLPAEQLQWCSATVRVVLRGPSDTSILAITRTLVPESQRSITTGWQHCRRLWRGE